MSFTLNNDETDPETDSGFLWSGSRVTSGGFISASQARVSVRGDLRPRLPSSSGDALKKFSISFSTTSEAASHIKIKEYLTFSDWYFPVY